MAYVMKSCIGIGGPAVRRAPRRPGAIDGGPGRAPRRQTDRRPETPRPAARPRSRAALAAHQCLLVGTADRPVAVPEVLFGVGALRYSPIEEKRREEKKMRRLLYVY